MSQSQDEREDWILLHNIPCLSGEMLAAGDEWQAASS